MTDKQQKEMEMCPIGLKNRTEIQHLKEHSIAAAEAIRALETMHIDLRDDIQYIKNKIDNGMSQTIQSTHTKVDSLLLKYVPMTIDHNAYVEQYKKDAAKIVDHEFWVGKFKQACFWITITSVGGGLVSIVFVVAKMAIEKVIHTL